MALRILARGTIVARNRLQEISEKPTARVRRSLMNGVTGIHHITGICGDPQQNIDFYCGLLGLRLVKLTVNFDDPGTYHLYYGTGDAAPGSIITFFPWLNAPRGRMGTGQATVTGYAIPPGALPYWEKRLTEHNTPFTTGESDFGEAQLSLLDPDGAAIELVEAKNDNRTSRFVGPLPRHAAIRGFHRVVLTVDGYERTAGLLTTQLGFTKVNERAGRLRFSTSADGLSGTLVDIHCRPDLRIGATGVGTTHHVAWRASSDEHELALRTALLKAGHLVTPVIDRNYFHSVYFREPGHVLFEIATDHPGFTVDEPLDTLGSSLKLPAQHESRRAQLQATLPPLRLPETSAWTEERQ